MKRMLKLLTVTFILSACCASYASAEAQRSDVPTCPLISWEEYLASRSLSAACGDCRIDSRNESNASYTTTGSSSTPYESFFCKSSSENENSLISGGENSENGPDGSVFEDSSSLSPAESQLYNLINSEREKNGLSPLTLDAELSALAEIKSEDMVENGYFAHESPTYGSAEDLLESAGTAFVSVGENIARNASVEKAHAALMSSSNHRRNILGSQWKKVGVGIAEDENGYPYVTELFTR